MKYTIYSNKNKKLKMLSIISILEGLLLIVPALLTVAFVTIAERKTMASMQRRLGPNAVGYYGLLQAFADALKLLLKEYIAPTQANIVLFFLGPMITLIFALLGYLVVPYGSGIFVSDYSLGMLYMLAVSSLATYGILLAGWSANSKYAFLGSLRSTAQLISYELILSSVILLVILLTGNLNMITIVESQRIVDFLLPLFPLFIIFFVGSIAETNRAPFDLAEAESELVSGFMTEHSASIFVFFFLAEYASIVLICILNSILFLGGYLCIIPVNLIIDVLNTLLGIDTSILEEIFVNISSSPLNLAVKTAFLVFVFIWVRASFPRIRFDQLMSVCWTVLLPLIIAYVVLLPCVIYGLDALPTQILL
jgi:NADH-ubiquinone oxidoreductase chain 1